MSDDSKKIGDVCRTFRTEQLGLTQTDVAIELGYSQENISAFENGRNSNNAIFLWYVRKGLLNFCSIDEICGGCS